MSRALSIAAALRAVLLGLAVLALPGAAKAAAETLVLQLPREPQFEFAGYYAALWQGFYRDAGLAVEIKPGMPPGRPPIDPVRELTEGRAQFGVGGVRLLIRTAQGLPLLLLAPIFQQSGAAVYYRADRDFAMPGALVNARIGRFPASNILDLELATALRGEGIDATKLQTIAIEPGQTVAALADGTVDAAIGSAWEVPWQARERGIELKSFDPGDYRVEFYGDSLFTLQRFEQAHPQTVRNFREASLKGWDYALQHSDDIARQILAKLPVEVPVADANGFARYQAGLAHRLARYPGVPLGHSNPDRWSRIQQSLVDAGAMLRTADLDAFVYDPDREARQRTDWRASAILAATGIVAVLVTIALVRRRRRRRGAAAPRVDLRPAVADLNAVLTALEGPIRQLLPRSASVRLSLLPELWLCQTDPPHLAALILDLVAEAGADLVVGSRNFAIDAQAAAQVGAAAGDYVRVTVKDSGPGLSEAALDQVYDPSATARPAIAAAWQLTRGLGGFARVESAEGIGTAVHLYFRRTSAGTAAVAVAEPSAKAAE